MNRLNTDNPKLRSTDPTGATAFVAVLFLACAPFVTAYGLYKAGESIVHQLSPHHPVPHQALVRSPASKSQLRS